MILDLTPRQQTDLWAALRDHERERRRNGEAVPPTIADLIDALWPGGKRHARPDPVARRRKLAAERSRRWRARQRGEDVPLLQPGRPKKRHKIAS